MKPTICTGQHYQHKSRFLANQIRHVSHFLCGSLRWFGRRRLAAGPLTSTLTPHLPAGQLRIGMYLLRGATGSPALLRGATGSPTQVPSSQQHRWRVPPCMQMRFSRQTQLPRHGLGAVPGRGRHQVRRVVLQGSVGLTVASCLPSGSSRPLPGHWGQNGGRLHCGTH